MYEADAYEPLGTLKPFAQDLWLVDGPIVRMYHPIGAMLPFPTRMTVIRLSDGGLWLNSPVALSEGLRAELAELGPVRAIAAPNRLHVTWLGDWAAAFPEAEVWGAPGVREAVGEGVRVDRVFGEDGTPAWAGEVEPILAPGGSVTEVAFFHGTSRTLVLTDLLQNFEPKKVHGAWAHRVLSLAGVLAPDGSTPRDLRLTFARHRDELRAATERMLALAPERIVVAHGRCIEEEATLALWRALAWTGVDQPGVHQPA